MKHNTAQSEQTNMLNSAFAAELRRLRDVGPRRD